MEMQQFSRQSVVAVDSAPCAQYQTVMTLLDGSRTSFGETITGSSRLANLPVAPIRPNLSAILLQADSPSPPLSNLPHLSAPTFLRI